MAYLLVHNLDTHKANRGDVQRVIDRKAFGQKEKLPQWIRLQILDSTSDNLKVYCKRWRKSLDISLVTQNPSRWRLEVRIDPKIVSSGFASSDITNSIKQVVLNETNLPTTEILSTPNSLLLDVQKGGGRTLQSIRRRIRDEYKDKISDWTKAREFTIPSTTMDSWQATALAVEAANPSGLPSDLPHISITRSVFVSLIRDRKA